MCGQRPLYSVLDDRCDKDSCDRWHTIYLHCCSTTSVLVAERPLTLHPRSIIMEMIPDIFGPKVPFMDSH